MAAHAAVQAPLPTQQCAEAGLPASQAQAAPLGSAPCAPRVADAASSSLNADPFNLRAEELALQDCTQGVEVRRVWSEKEMVCSFDGRHFPGTPDGMFEAWDGALTCVQVVRVPLVAGLSLGCMQETLAQTVLTKVVKSQQWLRASHVVPQDFVIFCWLPFRVAPEVVEHAEALVRQVQQLDPRFSLRLRVPADPGALFPALFACNHDIEVQRSRGYGWSDVCTYGTSDAEDEDEECPWDITWGWELEWGPDAEHAGQEQVAVAVDECGSEACEDVEWEWDITWAWEEELSFLGQSGADGPERQEWAEGEGLDGEHQCRVDPAYEGSLPWDDKG